ncbi:MAG: AraC family transcriptional regulator ligand-binding domain-containing protein [Caulobacterales bacterium]
MIGEANPTSENLEGVSFAYLKAMLGEEKAQEIFGPVAQPGLEGAVVSFRDLWLLSNRHIHNTGDEGHELGRSAIPVGTFELLASTLHHAETIGEGFDRVAKASRLVKAGISLSIRRGGGKCSLALQSDSLNEPARTLYFSLWAIVFHCLLRWLTKRDLRPARVSLPNGASKTSLEALRLLQCPVMRATNVFTITYGLSDCSTPFLPIDLRPWEAETFLEYERLVSQFLNPTRPDHGRSLADRIRPELAAGRLRQAEVCTRLGISPAHLRRRLAEEGTSFRELVDGHRRQYFELLAASPQSLDLVAENLGYSDSRSLRRARKRWAEKDSSGDHNRRS